MNRLSQMGAESTGKMKGAASNSSELSAPIPIAIKARFMTEVSPLGDRQIVSKQFGLVRPG